MSTHERRDVRPKARPVDSAGGSRRSRRDDLPVRAGRWSTEVVQGREQAREEERRRLARELHDELGHALFGLKMNVVWLHQHVTAVADPDLTEVREKLPAMLDLVDRSIRMVNGIVTGLRPPALDQLGLIAALEWQTESFARQSGLRCQFTGTADVESLDMGRATGVFRMFQEMLTNVQRHAHANRVDVRVRRVADRLVLCVRDNGGGVDPKKAPAPRSFGLLGMRERALLLGGSLNIETGPRRGTTVTVRIPLANRRATARGSAAGTRS